MVDKSYDYHLGRNFLTRSLSMERNLIKKGGLETENDGVLEEYLPLDHIKKVSPHDLSKPISEGKYYSFYLPHHAVVERF